MVQREQDHPNCGLRLEPGNLKTFPDARRPVRRAVEKPPR
jgi:hypothetical protein